MNPRPGDKKQEILIWRRLPFARPGLRDHVLESLPGILMWLDERANWPTQRFKFRALTTNNVLKCPFVITTSYEGDGRPLDMDLHRYTERKLESLAHEVGEVFGGLFAPNALGMQAGIFLYSEDANPRWKLIPIHYSPEILPQTSEVLRYTKTDFEEFGPDGVYHWFTQCFELQKAEMRAIQTAHPEKNLDSGLKALAMLQSCADHCNINGWFRDCTFGYVDAQMCHIATYSVLDNPHPEDPSKVSVRCVRAAEKAVLAPSFIGCRPPIWLWRRQIQTDRFTEPFDKKVNESWWQTKIRRRFYEAAGSEFHRYATSPHYILARRLGWIAIEGFKGSGGRQIVDHVLTLVQDFRNLRDHTSKFPPDTPIEQIMCGYGDDEPFVESDSDESDDDDTAATQGSASDEDDELPNN